MEVGGRQHLFRRNLAQSYATAGVEVWRHVVLDRPAGACEYLIDPNSRFFLRLEVSANISRVHRLVTLCAQCE